MMSPSKSDTCAKERVALVASHLQQHPNAQTHCPFFSALNQSLCAAAATTTQVPSQEARSADSDFAKLPLPPIVKLKEGQLFPTYPEVLETSKEVGGVFTYIINNDRRMTFVTDPAAYRHVFYARDNKDVTLDSAKLAYHWFGIDKEMSRQYTRPGLDKTREAMQYGKMLQANNKVGQHIYNQLASWPDKGEQDLWNVAMFTFVPVVQHLFGKETFDASRCPAIAETLWKFDKDFRKVANGIPRKAFPDMEKLAVELSDNFKQSILKGNHLSDGCPVMKARLSVLEDPDHKTWTPAQKARFMFSVFWASQGNTIPGTFWMVALIAKHPHVMKKVQDEVRNDAKFKEAGKSHADFDAEHLPYIQACVKETLRLKVANVTLRNVVNDIVVSTSDGHKYHVPKGDEITVSSFVQHHDDRVYDRPYEFIPERWLNREYSDFEWFPFGAGTNKCSGRHLAQMELGTLAALFYRDFDIELLGDLPEEQWTNCVAMVGPVVRSLKFKYSRHKN